MGLLVVLVAIAMVLAAVVALSLLFVSRLYRKVSQGQALIINKARNTIVTFNGATVLPVVHKGELMDIGVKIIEIEKAGNDGLICRDNIRADIRVSFYVRVNPVADDVRKVAQLVGCSAASDPVKLNELFNAKFAEALKTAGKQLDFIELYDKREQFRSNVIAVIGEDLNGYLIDDVAIEYLEQTPIAQLDPNNVLDAEGIKKITEITSREQILSNNHRREAEKQIKAKDVETQQALYEMDRQEKSAEYRATREMATTKVREESLTLQVEAEERLKAEQAKMKVDEQLGVQQQNVQREVEVAARNKQRVIVVEEERIEKARQLEVVARQVETLAASKDVEAEKARVAELAKARIAVEKTVAEQEESILTLRAVEDANRTKEATVIKAGAEAEATLIETIKKAEADERAAEHQARQRLQLAEAGKDAAEFEAQAKIRISDAIRAEAAAEGLAEVEVQRASASAIEFKGKAEAEAIKAKAEAMKQLEDVGRDYDLQVRRLDAEVSLRQAGIDAQRQVATAQAEAMASSLQNADIDIVGGTDLFVDRLIGAAAMGKSIGAGVDQFANAGPAGQAIAAPYVNGDKDLVATLANAIAGVGPAGVAQLSVARLVNGLADHVGGNQGAQLRALLPLLAERGIDTVEMSPAAVTPVIDR
jgi:uncharacterized membrane protein YqiK